MGYGGRRGIKLGNIIGDPFALATISIALVCDTILCFYIHIVYCLRVTNNISQLAWIISFISSIIGQIEARDADIRDKIGWYPPYAWWSAVYMLFMIAGVFVVVAADVIQTYHVALVGYLACGLVLTTSSVNNLLYTFSGARQAAAAGFMLLSMVLVGLISS